GQSLAMGHQDPGGRWRSRLRRRLAAGDRAGGRARAGLAHGLHASGQVAPAHLGAYFDHGVRTFSFYTHDELAKILDATGQAKDLNLMVRLAVSAEATSYPLASK